MANEGMSTRRRRINYYLLNDGSDEEEMDLDRTSEPFEVLAAIADNIPLSPPERDTQTTETIRMLMLLDDAYSSNTSTEL